ncbi:MAG: type II toxin-antitoxin system HicA family toxin [Deltaproteobacteria bacterium]|nr:type II toxin-antitoxin system HicA family toxin [Deltaproteobacteria bacterium]
MKRKVLIRHLERQGCMFLREGGSHTVYFNPVTRQTSTIPRHREIHDLLAKKICKDLSVVAPSGK